MLGKMKKARLEANLTRRQLAEKLKCTVVTVYRYEDGTRVPKLETAKKIAHILGKTIEDLF